LLTFRTNGVFTVTLTASVLSAEYDSDPPKRVITVMPAPAQLPDLQPLSMRMSDPFLVGQPGWIRYWVTNSGNGGVTNQSWVDAVYLSTKDILDSSATLLASLTVSNNLGAGGAYSNTVQFTVPSLAEGQYYLLASVDDQGQILERHKLNNVLSVQVLAMIPVFSNGVPFASQFSSTGDQQVYQINLTNTGPMQISFSAASAGGNIEMYAKLGSPPTRGKYRVAVDTNAVARVGNLLIAGKIFTVTQRGTDLTPPTLTITAPKPNQQWSNAVFTVKGTASDNIRLDSVSYQLNNGAWTNALGTTNWTATVVLVPGTNTLRAYALNANGNASKTNSVSFMYALWAALTVQTTGSGRVTPNYNGQLLQIGRNYTMTAVGSNGFAFSTRTSTQGWVSNTPTINFLMRSNLVLTANFVDVTKPTIGISSPVANQRWSNAVFTVKGTAKDNVRVSNVWCLTNGVWGSANLGSGGTNWAINVTLVPGTNTVKACAVDGAGNRSPTNSVNFVYVVSDRLGVMATGPCMLSPNYSNAMLEIGKSYSMTATPKTGYVFSNWVGTVSGNVVIVTNTPRLTFIMQSNLVLQANIIPNPFLRAKGTYNGLFAEAGRAQESSGFFTLAVTDKGAYSGSLRRGTSSYSLSGQFDVAGWANKTVLRPGTNSWALTMWLDLAGAEVLTGTVGDGDWLADLWADRAVFNAQTNPATLYAGKYTLIVRGSTDASASPGGEGYGTVVVSGAGQVTFSGSLADGSALSQSVPVSRDGRWPLYASLYTGKGSVWGWLAFDAYDPARSLQGELSWIKPAQLGIKYYPAGFTNEVTAVGSRYTQPAGLTNRVIHLTNGVVSFEGGNLSAPFTNLVSLTLSNRVINASSNTLSLTLSSGLFSGSATVPVTRQNVSFKGALLQNMDVGYGYFLGTNQSGSVYFGE
jgi:hypothetical protein